MCRCLCAGNREVGQESSPDRLVSKDNVLRATITNLRLASHRRSYLHQTRTRTRTLWSVFASYAGNIFELLPVRRPLLIDSTIHKGLSAMAKANKAPIGTLETPPPPPATTASLGGQTEGSPHSNDTLDRGTDQPQAQQHIHQQRQSQSCVGGQREGSSIDSASQGIQRLEEADSSGGGASSSSSFATSFPGHLDFAAEDVAVFECQVRRDSVFSTIFFTWVGLPVCLVLRDLESYGVTSFLNAFLSVRRLCTIIVVVWRTTSLFAVVVTRLFCVGRARRGMG